jgi:hypothetical protein
MNNRRARTRNSEISEWRCPCTATCSNPIRTPFDNSQSSPRQHLSLISTTALSVLASLEKSPCLQSKDLTRIRQYLTYCCCFSSFDNPLREDTYSLPLFNQRVNPSPNNSVYGKYSDTRESAGRPRRLRYLLFEIARNGHFVNAVDPFAHRFFVKSDRSILSPHFERGLCEECRQQTIILYNRMISTDHLASGGLISD